MSDKEYSSIKHENAAGRVEFDGGKAVWQWDQDANDSTSILIKSVDNPDLELEVTQRTPIAAGRRRSAGADEPKRRTMPQEEASPDWEIPDSGGSGFDPYNSSS